MVQQDAELQSMQVRHVMTGNPISVEPDVTVERVMALMREASIRHIPVVDDRGIVGIVSNRDLASIHGLPTMIDGFEESAVEEALQAPVAAVMKSRFLIDRDVVTIDRDAPLEQAVNQLVGTKLGALPVVDADGNLVGIITPVDVMRWVADDIFAGAGNIS